MAFRRDEAKGIAELLGVRWLSKMGPGWEDRAARLETVVAVAAWRQQSLEVRVDALIDALAAVGEPTRRRRELGDP